MLLNLFAKPLLLFDKTFYPQELADPRRILITHFGKLADIIRCIPTLVSLRHRFPHAEIGWLIEEHAAPILLDHWAVNRLIIVSSDWYKHVSQICRIRQRLQSFAPQTAVDLQNSFGSSFAAWLSRAKYRIGFCGEKIQRLHNIHVFTEKQNKIERCQNILQPFGIFGSSIGFDMPECEKDRLGAQNILYRTGLHGNFAMLHVSADSPETNWKEEHFGTVAKYLREQWNLPSLVTWTTDDDAYRAEAAVHAAGGAAMQVPWKTTLIERKSLAQLATLFVSSDTAELQIAAAIGTKCIGLFGATSAKENAPFGLEHRSVQSSYKAEKRKKRRTPAPDWMDSILPAKICEKCDEVLGPMLNPNILPISALPAHKKAA